MHTRLEFNLAQDIVFVKVSLVFGVAFHKQGIDIDTHQN
jgi:hypothetical protein